MTTNEVKQGEANERPNPTTSAPNKRPESVDDSERQDNIRIQGEIYAYQNIIRKCQSELRGCGAEMRTKDEFAEERIEVTQVLRRLCDEFGDNDWDDNLHLADVIDKHLGRYLGDRQ